MNDATAAIFNEDGTRIAADIFDPLVSYFPNAFETLPEDIRAADFLQDIKSGTYKAQTNAIRARVATARERGTPYDKIKKVADGLKKRLGAITLAGVVPIRDQSLPTKFTGLVQADFDLLGDRLADVRALVENDKFTFGCFTSASGEGLKAWYRVPICTSNGGYKLAAQAVAAHVLELTGVKIDDLKDVSRLCYASHDPACFHNPAAAPLLVDFSGVTLKEDEAKPRSQSFHSSPQSAGTRTDIATKLLGAIEWQDGATGYCKKCPGEYLHTSGSSPKDCMVKLNGVPTVTCFHKSCAGIIAGINHELRSQIGKAEFQPDASYRNTTAPGSDPLPGNEDEPNEPSAPETGARIREMLAARRFKFASVPPIVHPVYVVKGITICTPGNITAITAQLKSGKSSWLAAMMAAAMTNDPDADCFGIASSNPEGKALIHIDTEQATQDWDALIRQALKRARIDSAPAWLLSYCLTGWNLPDARMALPVILEDARREFGGIHSVLVDGVADLVPSVNDEEESLAFVSSLHGQAIEFHCPIVGAIHFNPNSDKTRGHLGSQMERKSETNLRLDKDANEAITAYSLKSRRAPITKEAGPRFAWDAVAGMHRSMESSGKTKADEDRETMRIHAEAAFERAGKSALGFCDLTRELRSVCALGDSGARKRLEKMIRARVVTKNLIGRYELAK